MENNKELLHDKYCPPTRSSINLDHHTLSSDLGLSKWVLDELYADFIFLEYIDVKDGLIEDDDGLIKVESSNKSWRKAKVLMISPAIKDKSNTRVGDIVLFPNDKGLLCGNVSYIDETGERNVTSNGIFLNDERIFAKISSL